MRRGDVVAVHSLRRGAAEALEAVVHGDRDVLRASSSRRIDEIELPPGTTIGAVVRGERGAHGAPRHADPRPSDHVIVFVIDKKTLPRVEKLFQVGARFL